jgi:hypothetical protein
MRPELLFCLPDLLQLPCPRGLRLQELQPPACASSGRVTFRMWVLNRALSGTRRTRALAPVLALCSPNNFSTGFQGPCGRRCISFWYPRLDYLCAHYLRHTRQSNAVLKTCRFPGQRPFYAIISCRNFGRPGAAKQILRWSLMIKILSWERFEVGGRVAVFECSHGLRYVVDGSYEVEVSYPFVCYDAAT